MATTAKGRPSRLGRGLSSLMTTPVPVSVPSLPTPMAVEASHSGQPAMDPSKPTTSVTSLREGLHHLSVTCLRSNPYQPRQQFDPVALEQLANSIRQDGLMQPIVVRPLEPPVGEITHELVAGERRWRAAKLAGLTHVPSLVRPLTDLQTAEFALIENVQREDLNPLDRAQAFAQLMQQFHLSHEQIAERVGMDRTSITNLMRLLDLHPDVQELIRHNTLSAGQAKALLGIVHPDQQRLLAERAVRGQWSVRQMEMAVRQLHEGQSPPDIAPKDAKAAHLKDLAAHIGQQLGTKVILKSGRRKGTGTITLEFYTLDQFDQLMQRLGVQTE